ncbi:MAG: DUF488 domain-containing protein [Sinobacteraceae bacterium]|nr:DUF488 domain-containing protein [Nevskiaceae bacterium]MBV8853099.1 DUF488 domain-containing protein [Nevskiaceae bacterium]MBV9914826.1 DUF488 domain-containing protein [Nevskiaceae bacterium]
MIHTIGHSNHPAERFLALLQGYGVDLVADVRSMPYSRFNPQYNRARLEQSLAAAGVGYLFMGQEFGARSPDPACYDRQGRVSYRKLAATAAFHTGLERLQALSRERHIALMCAERDPLDCHRTILVARALEGRGVAIRHILADGSCEEHADCMQRLIAQLHLEGADLFSSTAQRREQAYNLQAARIAYVKKKPA